jgi:hypothetical protein
MSLLSPFKCSGQKVRVLFVLRPEGTRLSAGNAQNEPSEATFALSGAKGGKIQKMIILFVAHIWGHGPKML